MVHRACGDGTPSEGAHPGPTLAVRLRREEDGKAAQPGREMPIRSPGPGFRQCPGTAARPQEAEAAGPPRWSSRVCSGRDRTARGSRPARRHRPTAPAGGPPRQPRVLDHRQVHIRRVPGGHMPGSGSRRRAPAAGRAGSPCRAPAPSGPAPRARSNSNGPSTPPRRSSRSRDPGRGTGRGAAARARREWECRRLPAGTPRAPRRHTADGGTGVGTGKVGATP